jgi:transmembrane sensor
MRQFISRQANYTEAQRREAVDWFLVMQANAEPSAESLQGWLRWMEQDDGNRAAFESVSRAWHACPSSSAMTMPTAHELSADDYDAEQSVAEWLAQQAARAPARPVLSRSITWLAAASIVAILLSLGIMYRYFQPLSGNPAEFVTRAGEQLELTLADGSRVWLGPKSRLIVGFTPTLRRSDLTSGEAFFSVHKDRVRPFTVHSAGGDITAVGTAFNVRAVSDRVTVSVSEGAVTVTPIAESAPTKLTRVRVSSGQELTFTAREPVKALSITQTPTPGERARWRDGVLVYRNEPLRDVVMDVVRYSGKQIEIPDPAVGALRYSGVVYQGAIDEWTHALPESFPVTLVSDGERLIISPR